MSPHLQLTLCATALAALAACQTPADNVPADTLVALKVDTPPDPAAGAADPVWARARALRVTATEGANLGAKPGDKGDSRVTIKAAYTADMLYLLVQHTDPTLSVRRGPYQKQPDGTWKKLKDPADQGGDDNVYYEDKWAFLWPIGHSIAAFDKEGCAALCHTGQGKPYGNKYTARDGERADLWHMKGSRTVPYGHVDDQYVDHTRYDPKASPAAGRKSDPGTATGEYRAFGLVGGKPEFMDRDPRPLAAGGAPYIKAGDEVPFDDSRFKPGDEVASYRVYPLRGDRADIRITLGWKDGVYTSVVSRKLVTGSRYDVQFDDLKARYGFGFAVFDNAQVRHATTDDPLYLVFGR